MSMFDIAGKNAVIVGGAGGIGQAIVQGLMEEGANVLISSRKEESLQRAQAELKEATGKDAKYYPCDASSEEAVNELLQAAVKEFGKIDILVCALGLNKKFPTEEFPMDIFRAIYEANVFGVMNCCKVFGPHMKENGYGKIVILSSVRDCVATKTPGNAGYASSKGAVKMLIKQVASEYGQYGITVNGIAPTVTETPMMTNIIEQRGGDAYRESLAKDLPMRRMAVPYDSVGAAVYLCTPASDFVTGNVIYCDGGLTATR